MGKPNLLELIKGNADSRHATAFGNSNGSKWLRSGAKTAKLNYAKLCGSSTGPKCAASMTEREKTGPEQFEPITSRERPKVTVARKGADAPRLLESGTNNDESNRVRDFASRRASGMAQSKANSTETGPAQVNPGTGSVNSNLT